MVKEPFGITTISGQTSHSLKLSFGFSVCSISGVNGCTPFTARICCGGLAGGCGASTAAGGFGLTALGLAEAEPARATANTPAANAVRSRGLANMIDPSGGQHYR